MQDPHLSFVVAIDGPAASGKGTIGRAIALRFGFRRLDTGLLYRAVAADMLKKSLDKFSPEQAIRIASEISSEITDEPFLRSREVSNLAPKVAAIPEVRAALVAFQRRFARAEGGAVLDGRDIGTVICPEAEVKLYVTASAEVRAHRRWLELGGDEAHILAEVLERDARDMGRADAPLRPAEDAVILDTSEMTVDEAVARAISVIQSRMAKG